MILDAISTVNKRFLTEDILSLTEETHEGPARQKVLLPQKDISYSPNIWGVPMTDEEIYTLLYACSQYDDVTVSMALSVMQQESQFTRNIISSDGHDYGFFQIRDSNHEWLREVTGCDPKTPLGNIVCGVYMLHYCHLLYGPSSRSALTAYRWGSDNGNYAYADLILSSMEHFESVSENQQRRYSMTRINARTLPRSTRMEYSCFDNDKEIRVTAYIDGLITPGQIKAISSFLGEPLEFSPSQVGLPTPNGQINNQSKCRINMDSLCHSVEDPTVTITVRELVGKFKSLRT